MKSFKKYVPIALLITSLGLGSVPVAKAGDPLIGTITSVDEEQVSIKKKNTNEYSTLYFEILRINAEYREYGELKTEERKVIVPPGDYKVGDRLGLFVDYTHPLSDYKIIVDRFAPSYEPIQKGMINVDAILSVD